MHTNYINYYLITSIEFIKYNRLINLYNKEIKLKNENKDDNTKIILLFMPDILKSITSEKSLDLDNPHFNPVNLILNKDKKQLENTIKQFFTAYADLKLNHKFIFHRREFYTYLDAFLNLNTENEEDLINKKREEKGFNLFEHFRPFLRPENYFTFSKTEKFNI